LVITGVILKFKFLEPQFVIPSMFFINFQNHSDHSHTLYINFVQQVSLER